MWVNIQFRRKNCSDGNARNKFALSIFSNLFTKQKKWSFSRDFNTIFKYWIIRIDKGVVCVWVYLITIGIEVIGETIEVVWGGGGRGFKWCKFHSSQRARVDHFQWRQWKWKPNVFWCHFFVSFFFKHWIYISDFFKNHYQRCH